MKIIETDRLILRLLTIDDAAFILKLLNDPTWKQFIGDKGVNTLEDARNYILTGPITMYSQLGYGLYLVELKESKIPIGLCGLIKRESLEDTDIGFAFLSEYQSKGHAYEAASATLSYGCNQLNLKRIVAITSKDNELSSKLLKKIGMNVEQVITPADGSEELDLFSYSQPR
ncbi:GNAT family N-acetyltransferase [Alkalihalobacillus sp. R86527]|uniref:GNAT family N-acetyltransferase n=1 Tax=Alkalihalobacillus sp. R86527 TaxID=3093863 RepID=UPI00367195A4